MDKIIFTDEQLRLITNILKHGNDCEIKRIRGEIVIVEIKRKKVN